MDLAIRDGRHYTLTKLGWSFIALHAIVALLGTAAVALSTGQWVLSVMTGVGYLLLGSSVFLIETWQKLFSKGRVLLSVVSAVYAACFIFFFKLISSSLFGSFSIQRMDVVLAIGTAIAVFAVTYFRWGRNNKQAQQK
jgi:hypothetical protein